MIRIVSSAIAAVLAMIAAAGAQAAGPEWKPLFNGKDLTGWEHVGPGEFTVENGVMRTSGGMGLLSYSGEKFGNAVIRVVYRGTTTPANSGVYIRIPEIPKDPWFAVHFGYEVQIDDGRDEFHRTGSLYSLSPAEEFPPSKNGWNTLEIAIEGQTTTVSVNGKQVNKFDGTQPVPERKKYYEPRRGPRPDSGYIGLQNHDGKSILEFREVSMRPLAQ
jgi:hypothetical protein